MTRLQIPAPLRPASLGLTLALVLLPTGGLQAKEEGLNGTERRLAAAGFEAIPATTPKRRTELAVLKPHKLVQQPTGDGFTYIYADPKGCNCLYMGDGDDYAAYQKLTLAQNVADENAQAAADASFAAWNWESWGPYDNWSWDGPRFIHGGF